MKNLVLAVALATVLFTVSMGARAASSNELAEIRQQLEALIQRVDKLEQENNALKAENENLKATDEKLQAQSEYLKAEARGLRKETAQQAVEVGKVKGADWASKVAITGDLRYRYEAISDETLNSSGLQTADRYRDRIRARLNATVEATDSITLGIGMATAENGDPRSSNQSLNDVFSRKSLDLDLAYFDWEFSQWGHLIGGKMKQPFVKPGQSLFWDNDINPEGLAVNFKSGMWFGTAYNYWINEESGPENTRTADTLLYGLQIGTRLPLGASSLMLAAHYYDLSAGQGRAPFFADNPNGNSVTADNELIYDYQVVNLSAEYSAMLGELPMQLWADVAQNQDPDELDTAWSAGVLFGKASNYRTWELGTFYQVIEKDALFAQLIDSDFAAGVSDAEGWVLRAGYAPVRNSLINATYFLNKRNVDAPNRAGQRDVDYQRLQLDFSVKF
ncbi:putative porin [Steroidobacter sp. S1-65]|uniref:Porin n=1 Tax=Steroidobacter gossypii TaxID=2805490 RepID=A0ABS1WVP8_9GAMM|nr:putative porin [Steroidobacter gossypii]MBM0105050.1 putative porin [Steroidobacter gossypii]